MGGAGCGRRVRRRGFGRQRFQSEAHTRRNITANQWPGFADAEKNDAAVFSLKEAIISDIYAALDAG